MRALSLLANSGGNVPGGIQKANNSCDKSRRITKWFRSVREDLSDDGEQATGEEEDDDQDEDTQSILQRELLLRCQP